MNQLSYGWRSVPLGGSYQLEVLGANTVMDHRLDQYCWLGRADCHGWPLGVSIDYRSHLLHEPIV